ncbi:type II toxin-antitoxin system RelE/ParE family toxin [Puteibacter caeruleilacunae]|nr:type II toxin-antitoxin system RelE/ParE family toxin [Puteibacter caeruleilacunae]
MKDKKVRHIFFYKNYYLDFFKSLNAKVQEKLNWTLKLISTVERVPIKYFRFIENSNGLYEVRVEVGSDIFRVFCFFDEGKLVILINGFQKKTQKTSKREIEKAEKLKKEYFNEKRKR